MKLEEKINRIYDAAQDKSRVQGLTHNFYRYPARFSPVFARTAIELFSKPGDIVLDPYMGGGTTIIEAAANGRRAIGVDLNSLACFIARVKTTLLSTSEKRSLLDWIEHHFEDMKYHHAVDQSYTDDKKTRNLDLVKARYIKKIVAIALSTIQTLPTRNAQDFARCVILKTAQNALDGQRGRTPTASFRKQLRMNLDEMLNGISDYEIIGRERQISIYEKDAALIDTLPAFSNEKRLVDLVVTSPPYPGLHVLYHRWQVDGRKESPAPYWITGTCDGQGDSYYNFGSRHQPGFQKYFDASMRTLRAIHKVMKPGAHIIQMVAFCNPEELLPRYLWNMEELGFKEVLAQDRIWRDVPNRKWHATFRGHTQGSKEVVLIHKSVAAS
ncbi:MAG: site-specific DNA-methyltransferase [Planctomycetaceae bacterium]|nr:site-specific DNA-methyltransferase [Planctomycetaceae bacterium]